MIPQKIIEQIAKKHGLTIEHIRGKSRYSDIVKVRKEIISVLHFLDFSASTIGRVMGYKDHTCVLHHLKEIKGRVAKTNFGG